jgi:hypothetical protein
MERVRKIAPRLLEHEIMAGFKLGSASDDSFWSAD